MNCGPDKILIRCPNWVGDVVMATPAIRSLRKRYPQARLAVFIKSYARQLLDHSPHIDEFLTFDPDGEHSSLAAYYRFLRSLRKHCFDLSVILPNSFRSAWEMRFIGARRRIGYLRQGRGLLLTDPVQPEREGRKLRITNMVDYYLRLVKEAGCDDLDQSEELFVSEEGEARIVRIFEQHNVSDSDLLVGLAPGSGYGPAKLYPPEKYAEVLDALIEKYGCKALITTSPEEHEIGETVCSQMRNESVHLSDLGLDALKSLVKRLSLLITNDTGPRHIAVAFDRPVVVVFGPTSTLYTDVNLGKTEIVREEVECSPCQLKVCPIDHRCMTRLGSNRVFDAAENLLSRFVLNNPGYNILG